MRGVNLKIAGCLLQQLRSSASVELLIENRNAAAVAIAVANATARSVGGIIWELLSAVQSRAMAGAGEVQHLHAMLT